MKTIDNKRRTQVIAALVEGNSIRVTVRTIGVDRMRFCDSSPIYKTLRPLYDMPNAVDQFMPKPLTDLGPW